jgi:hypothetical protein
MHVSCRDRNNMQRLNLDDDGVSAPVSGLHADFRSARPVRVNLIARASGAKH